MKNAAAENYRKGIVDGISMSLGVLILLAWVLWLALDVSRNVLRLSISFELLNPSFFYAAACLICAVVVMSIGSSRTTAATVGVALMGVLQAWKCRQP